MFVSISISIPKVEFQRFVELEALSKEIFFQMPCGNAFLKNSQYLNTFKAAGATESETKEMEHFFFYAP